jgi:hypothetical protein
MELGSLGPKLHEQVSDRHALPPSQRSRLEPRLRRLGHLFLFFTFPLEPQEFRPLTELPRRDASEQSIRIQDLELARQLEREIPGRLLN